MTMDSMAALWLYTCGGAWALLVVTAAVWVAAAARDAFRE